MAEPIIAHPRMTSLITLTRRPSWAVGWGASKGCVLVRVRKRSLAGAARNQAKMKLILRSAQSRMKPSQDVGRSAAGRFTGK